MLVQSLATILIASDLLGAQHLFDNSLSEFKMLFKCSGVAVSCVDLDTISESTWTSILRLNSDSKFLGCFYGTIFFGHLF